MVIPIDALSRSFSYLSIADVPEVACSCREFSVAIETSEVQSSLIEQLAFGPKDWKRFFGEVGEVPPIPENMAEILKSQCPFNPGKQVRDTHMLVLIPYTVNSRPFTLNLLKELIQNPKEKNPINFIGHSHLVKDLLGDDQTARPYWILMTKEVIPGSRNKTYDDQKKLFQESQSNGYELPIAIEAAASILMHYFKTDKYLYGQDPRTFTRCKEIINPESQLMDGPCPVVIGGFSNGGVYVEASIGWRSAERVGVAAVRKFSR